MTRASKTATDAALEAGLAVLSWAAAGGLVAGAVAAWGESPLAAALLALAAVGAWAVAVAMSLADLVPLGQVLRARRLRRAEEEVRRTAALIDGQRITLPDPPPAQLRSVAEAELRAAMPQGPEVVAVTYGRLVSRADYSNERVELTARVPPGGDWLKVYGELGRLVAAALAERDEVADLRGKVNDLRRKADDEERRLARLKADAERVREFLRRHGVDPDKEGVPF